MLRYYIEYRLRRQLTKYILTLMNESVLHLKLNTGVRPIANKYREGKMKRTLKRELKST